MTWTAKGAEADQYNAMGYNPTDGMLYAMRYATATSPNILVRIDPGTGATENLGEIDGFTNVMGGPNNGEFDPDGNFWVTNSNSTRASKIDVNATGPGGAPAPKLIDTLPLTGKPWGGADMAYLDGYMWGVSNGTSIVRFSLDTGEVESFPPPAGMLAGTYGAAFQLTPTDLVFGVNTGPLFQIRVDNAASANPTFVNVAKYTSTPSGNNDGASMPPVAMTKDDSATTKMNTPVTVSVLGNDNMGTKPTVAIVEPDANGTWKVNPDGTVTFTPKRGFVGEATAVYKATDPDTGLASSSRIVVTVTTVVDPVDDTAATPYDTPATVDVLDNDTVPNGSTVTDVVAHEDGQGTWTITEDGEVKFTPDPGFVGDATATYTVEAPDGTPGTATVTVTVQKHPLVAEDDTSSTPINTPVTIDAIGNDDVPPGGEVTGVTGDNAAQGSWAVVDGKVVYTPAGNYRGKATATYTVTAPDGRTAAATITVTVTEDAPIAEDDSAWTEVNTPITVDVVENDTLPAGTVVADVTGDHGTWEVTKDGEVTFNPAPDYSGEATATYTVTTPGGQTDQATVTVRVLSPLAAENDATTTAINTPVTVDVTANDDLPEGTVITKVGGDNLDHGEWAVKDGRVVYTPAKDYRGKATATYTVTDPDGRTTTATISVTVIEDAPVAENDTATTEFNTPVTVDVVENDTLPEGTVVSGVTGDHGTWKVVDGQVEFTPADGYSGDATATYTVTTPGGQTATATVTVTVLEQLVANDDTGSTELNTPVTVDVATNDTLPKGAVVTEADGDHGSWTVTDDGQVEFTPEENYRGEATGTYTVTAPDGRESTASITVTVTEDAPIAENDTATTGFNTPVTVDVVENDTLPEGTVVSGVTGYHGTWTVVDGQVEFTPAEGYAGDATATYTVTTLGGQTATAEITVTVLAPVVARNDSATTRAGTAVTVDVAKNDTLPAGTIVDSATGNNGTWRVVSGRVVYTPKAGFAGKATGSYTIRTTDGRTATATVSVTVTAVAHDAPPKKNPTPAPPKKAPNERPPHIVAGYDEALPTSSVTEDSASPADSTQDWAGHLAIILAAVGLSGAAAAVANRKRHGA